MQHEDFYLIHKYFEVFEKTPKWSQWKLKDYYKQPTTQMDKYGKLEYTYTTKVIITTYHGPNVTTLLETMQLDHYARPPKLTLGGLSQ